MSAETFISSTYAHIASTSLAFADGFFSSGIFEYFLYIIVIGGIVGAIIVIAKKISLQN